MATKNKEATRYHSDRHEKSICKALGAIQQSNSGAGRFRKGDVIQNEASLLIEAKTTMTDKDSFSVKKDWILKNKEEAFSLRKSNSCICFNFGPEQENYYVINEKLMKFLVEKMIEENS
jgi:hypothetical protein